MNKISCFHLSINKKYSREVWCSTMYNKSKINKRACFTFMCCQPINSFALILRLQKSNINILITISSIEFLVLRKENLKIISLLLSVWICKLRINFKSQAVKEIFC